MTAPARLGLLRTYADDTLLPVDAIPCQAREFRRADTCPEHKPYGRHADAMRRQEGSTQQMLDFRRGERLNFRFLQVFFRERRYGVAFAPSLSEGMAEKPVKHRSRFHALAGGRKEL